MGKLDQREEGNRKVTVSDLVNCFNAFERRSVGIRLKTAKIKTRPYYPHANGNCEAGAIGPAAYGESGDSSSVGGKLRSGNRRGSSPRGDLDLRGFEYPEQSLVHLVDSVAKIPSALLCLSF